MTDTIAWQKALLGQGATVQDAIRNLDKSGLRIVMVVDSAGVLQGTVSDGDIRRGLLRGLTMAEPVASVTHPTPLVVPPELPREAVLQLMLANKVQQLPIVNAARQVVGLQVWDAVNALAQRENIMVVMAGGKGVRLRPHTENCPKPMLLVAGKPMLEHILLRAKAAGFHRFVFAVHYLGHMIEEYFEGGAAWDVQIDYLREDEPLGTAGALGLLSPHPTRPFVISNGDVLSDINYGDLLDFHLRHEAVATMAVRAHEWQNPFGVVQTRGIDITGFQEKPVYRSHINAGVYAMNPAALAHLPIGRCDMPTLFERLADQNLRTVAYPMHEPWLDVGRPTDLAQAQSDFDTEASAV